MDVNQLFRRAERAFFDNQLEKARADVLVLLSLVGEDPAVLHLLALVERRADRLEDALAAFQRAVAAGPPDPGLLLNYANLLVVLGRLDEALAQYEAALALSPTLPGLRLNRAILLQRLERHGEAIAEFDALRAVEGDNPKVLSARAISLHKLGRLEEAAAEYDAVLTRDPRRLVALHGRARVALERGEPDASRRYQKALDIAEGNLDLMLGLAEALVAEGDPAGMTILSQAIGQNPGWCAGLEALARMRAEAGEGSRFADHYAVAMTARPSDPELRRSYVHTLTLAGRHGEALEVLRSAPPQTQQNPEHRFAEVLLLEALGERPAALGLIDQLERGHFFDPALDLAHGRIALGHGETDRAASILQRLVTNRPDDIAGWAHLDLCWRLLDDPRHHWLSRQDGLVAQRPLDLDGDFLTKLAGLLRRLHCTRSHPIGQSLRGGTQTRGRLFSRCEPEIKILNDALNAAVHSHFKALPALDQRHPLLRHRNAVLAIQGAWSVRLTGAGFHISHIHPHGVLSSACHISLTDIEGKEGWLELGRPPTELKLDLGPLARFQPMPGRVVLFPSYMFHGTTPFQKGERLTVAFDVVVHPAS